MTNKEAEDIAYELSGVLEHRGDPCEVVCYTHEMIGRLRRAYKKIDDHIKQNEELQDVDESDDPPNENGYTRDDEDWFFDDKDD